jgi:hypothetical protein
MKRFVLLASVVAALLGAALPRLGAQVAGTNQPATPTVSLTADQALPLTCAQAWVVSGKDYASMLGIIVTLAKVSLVNRELTFPNTREAGVDAGKGIAQDCKADPRALLYAVVDKHVRRVVDAQKN